MFNFFKKQIHEPISLQAEDVIKQTPLLAKKILSGINCDKLPNGKGEFGSQTNPIPVNGAIGEIKYLGKLRGKTKQALFFHRIGSIESQVCDNPIDCYEVVCIDGTQWNKLYFDFYHPRRSNIAPKGYYLMPFDKKLKFDLPMGFGINEYVHNFPYGIPDSIMNLYGSSALTRIAKERLNKHNFTKKNLQQKKLENKHETSIENEKLNPAFNYVKEKYGINCTAYKSFSLLIHNHANSASVTFAKLMKKKTNEEIIHFFYDYFLSYIASIKRKDFPANNDAFSAIIDGIHIEYYGNVKQEIIKSILDLYVTKEFCFLKTSMYHLHEQNLKMFVDIAVYCLIKPEMIGIADSLDVAKDFVNITKYHLEILINEFETLIKEVPQ